MADRLALGHAEAAHDGVQTVTGEDAQQVVLAGQEEFRGAGVALTAGPAAQLVVDAAAFVAFGAEDEQTAGGQRLLLLHGDVSLETGLFLGLHLGGDLLRHVAQVLTPFLQAHFQVAAQLDVGAAAGHVGGDGHHTGQAGVGDDIGFLLVLAGVQHAVRNALAGPDLDVEILVLQRLIGLLGLAPRLLVLAGHSLQQMGVLRLQRLEGDLVLIGLEQFGQGFRLLDRHRADQDRLTLDVAFGDQAGDGLVLLGLGAEDLVVVVDPLDGPVGRHFQDVHLVDVEEFLGLGRGRAGHAGQLLVEAEIVLDGDRGQGLVLGHDLHALLGLDGLVQAFGQAAALHHPAGELIDQHDLAGLDDVVLVLLVQGVGAQGLVDVVDQGDVGRVVQTSRVGLEQAALFHDLLDLLRALLGQQRLTLLLVQVEGGLVLDQFLDDAVDDQIQVRPVFRRARDDQRRARLVDQDGVDLIDDREMVRTLHHLLAVIDQVIAQIVEAEFVVGAVGDVGRIGRLALARGQAVDDDADLHAQEAIDPAHPFGVASGQIVVDRDDVHALAGERVQIHRRHGDQGLALTGAHLGDAAVVQDHAARQLDVVLALAQHPPGRLAGHGEGLVQDLVQRLTAREPVAEGVGHHPQLIVRQGGELAFQRVDLLNPAHEVLDLAVVGGAENLLGDAEHG